MVAAHGRPRAAGRVRAPGRRGGGASQQAAAAGRAASGHAHQSGLVEEGDRLIIVPTRRQSRRQTQWAWGGMSRERAYARTGWDCATIHAVRAVAWPRRRARV
jgi:hypothetical protein